MEKDSEQRTEQRLHYRWPVRFVRNLKEKPAPGQIVDVSSKGLAILCHADKNCPHPDQMVTIDFGVPHFDSADSFDPVFFNRIGRVCRVDNLRNKVNRVALQFAEPLFFKPGEQDISESDVQQRLQAKTRSIVKAEEKARIYREALVIAEERTRSYTKAKFEAQEELKAEIEARTKAEAKLRDQAKEKLRAYAEAKAGAEERAKAHELAKAETEEKLKAEIEARCKAEAGLKLQAQQRAKAEAKAKAQAMLRAKAQKKAKAEAQKREKLEAEMKEKIKSFNDQIDKIKAEAAGAIAKAKAQAEDNVAKVKAKFEQKTKAYAEAKIRAEKKAAAIDKQPTKETLLKKVEKFITDRNRIY